MTADFAADYSAALIKHLRLGGEAELEAAHALGRRALTAGLGVLDVVAQHYRTEEAAADLMGVEVTQVRKAALPFLLQSLAALDMASHGFVEASERAAVEQAHVAQLQLLAGSFVDSHIEHIAIEQLMTITESVRMVMSAAGAYVELGELQAGTGNPPPIRELITSALVPATVDARRGAWPGSTPAYWAAARLDVVKEYGASGLVVVWRDTEFSAFDEAVLVQFANRAAGYLRNARLYEREHEIAFTLQNSLLPDTPRSTDELAIAARYQPGGSDSGVGGDWFEVIELPDRRVALVIGDVMGHGISAATFMGQLSVAVRAYAVDGHQPVDLLSRIDQLLATGHDDRLATIVFAILDAAGNLQFANAGHPPPLLVSPGQPPTYLRHALSQPVSMYSTRAVRRQHITTLTPGSLLILYSDGLIESRTQPIDVGLDQLRYVVASHADESVEAICDVAMESLVHQPSRDDACILAVRIPAD